MSRPEWRDTEMTCLVLRLARACVSIGVQWTQVSYHFRGPTYDEDEIRYEITDFMRCRRATKP
jgi:hypothetical protein